MKRKQSYVLLELMIAVALVAMSSLYLIRNPYCFLKKEIESLEKMEWQRISEVKFANIKKELYSGTQGWDSKSEEKVVIELPGLPSRSHLVSYEIKAEKKKILKGTTHALVGIRFKSKDLLLHDQVRTAVLSTTE